MKRSTPKEASFAIPNPLLVRVNVVHEGREVVAVREAGLLLAQLEPRTGGFERRASRTASSMTR